MGDGAGQPQGGRPENACGKNIAVQSNTVQETEDLPARQKKCGSNKINVLSLRTRAKPQPPSSAARQTPCWPTRQ